MPDDGEIDGLRRSLPGEQIQRIISHHMQAGIVSINFDGEHAMFQGDLGPTSRTKRQSALKIWDFRQPVEIKAGSQFTHIGFLVHQSGVENIVKRRVLALTGFLNCLLKGGQIRTTSFAGGLNKKLGHVRGEYR